MNRPHLEVFVLFELHVVYDGYVYRPVRLPVLELDGALTAAVVLAVHSALIKK